MTAKRNQTIDIKVGYTCNNNCLHCVAADFRGVAPDISTDNIISLLKQYQETCLDVVFTGGEFTIRRDAVHLLAAAKNLNYRYITIQTNARMLSSIDYAREFHMAGMNGLVAALIGSNPKIHNTLANCQSFYQTTAGIRNCVILGISTSINTVISTFNVNDLTALVKLASRLGVRYTKLTFPHIQGNAMKNAKMLIPTKTETVASIRKAVQWSQSNRMTVMVEAIPFCLMQGMENHVIELYSMPTKVWQAGNMIDDFLTFRRQVDKAKRTQCRQCIYDNICEGPWKEYPAFFGWKEFQPVTRGHAVAIRPALHPALGIHLFKT